MKFVEIHFTHPSNQNFSKSRFTNNWTRSTLCSW